MSNEDAINVTRDQIHAFNEQNWEKWSSVTIEDCVYDEVATHKITKGRENVIEVMKAWKSAFPDVKGTIENITSDGVSTTTRVTWYGKHTGPLQTPNGDIPPTGKEIEIRSCYLAEVKNGKITKFENYFDMMTMMTQLGLAN
jgi:steroid delta-isomerase-like uncharacterized protein